MPHLWWSASLAATLLAIIVYPYLSIPEVSIHCYTRIDTLDAETPAQDCLTVFINGTFGRIFSDDVPDIIGSDHTEGYVLPGLWDGHGHVLQYGEMLDSVKLYGAESIDEVKERVKEYLIAHPRAGRKEKWIRGIGWDQANFAGKMPSAKELSDDPQLQGLYIMLDRVDVHCTWVSQPILNLLPSPLPDVPGGEIPTAGVFCDNAMDLPLGLWPRPGKVEKMKFLEDAVESLHGFGIVGVHDAGVSPDELELYIWMAEMGILTLRVYGMLECPVRNTFCPDVAQRIERTDGILTVRSVKLFADGALGSWGAALLDPYSDKPETHGTMLINSANLEDITRLWYAENYQVNIHAIGDRANQAAISAFQKVLAEDCQHSRPRQSPLLSGAQLESCMAQRQSDRRLRLEHTQIVTPEDQALIHQLGILPSVQPTHATSDMNYALSRLGHTRLSTSAYRMRSLLSSSSSATNQNLILGSDFPVEPPSPFSGIYAATKRLSPATGTSANESCNTCAWYPEELLSFRQAMDGFTKAPAWGAFMEGKAGVIREGSWADWIVVDRDIFEEGIDLREVQVMETWIGGRRMFKRKEGGSGILSWLLSLLSFL